MDAKIIQTDFVFKDNRDYVHSTTMCELMCDLVYQHLRPRTAWISPRMDVKFHRLIRANGRFGIGRASDRPWEGVVDAEFILYDSKEFIYGFFEEDPTLQVDKRIRSNPIIENLRLTEKFAGECLIAFEGLASLLENIIEANKRVHVLTIGSPATELSVLNMYMRRFPVGLNPPASGKVILRIDNISSRTQEGATVTLNRLTIPELCSDDFELSYLVKRR